MALFFVYPGRLGGGLESTLAPYEVAKELGIDARLFLSVDNERRGLVSRIYPEAQFFNFTSPADILKMRNIIGDNLSFFTMISPKMFPLYGLVKKKLFYFHATYDHSLEKKGGAHMMDRLHDLAIKGSTLTLVTKAPLAWQIHARLNKHAETFPHPPYLLKPGFFAAEKKIDLPFEKYFLYFGDVDREAKGVDVLVKALERFPQIKAIIAGRGGSIAERGNIVHMKGWLEEGAMHYLIKNAQSAVLPYLVPAQFSGCLALSFRFGTPVIGSNLPTFQDWIDEGETGWYFSSGDAASLGEKMLDVWEGRSTYSKAAIAKKELEMKNLSKSRLKEILEDLGYKD